MMHPALSLAFFLFFVVNALWSLETRRVRMKWWMIHREDHPTLYWLLVGSKVFLVIVLPIYCLDGWRDLMG